MPFLKLATMFLGLKLAPHTIPLTSSTAKPKRESIFHELPCDKIIDF